MQWQLGPDRREAQQVRRDAVRWLASMGVEETDTAELVIAELLANAVRAAAESVTLELAADEGRVEIVVTDDGRGFTALPDPTQPPVAAEQGRGLYLVRMLSSDLQSEATPSGTTMRCRMSRADLGALAT